MAGRLSSQSNTGVQSAGRLSSTLPPIEPRKPIKPLNVLNKVGGFLGVKNYGESLGQSIAQPFVRSKVAEANAVTADQTQRIQGLMKQSQDPSRYKRALELVSDTQKMHTPRIQEITPVLKKNNRQLVGEAISAGTAIGGGALGANVAQQGVRSVRAGAGILRTIAPAVATGTAGGALAGLGTGLEQKDATPQSVAKSVAINAAVGAGAAGLLSAGAQGVGRLASKYMTKAPIDEIANAIDTNVTNNVPEVPVKTPTLSPYDEYSNTVAPKDYNDIANFENQSKATEIEKNLSQLKVEKDALEQSLNVSPYKRISKYANRNGELPEVGSGKSKFGTIGDRLAMDNGFSDSEQMRAGYDQYKKQVKLLDDYKTRIRSMGQERKGLLQPIAQAEKQSTNAGTGKLAPIESTSTTKVRGLSRGVEAKAVENKLVDTFGELPEYQTVNMAEQAQKASDMLSNDYEKAKRIAMGQELAPNDVIPESIFTAVENQAIKNGDVETLRQLATQSSLSSEATTMGQRIRALAERNPDSPITAIQKIQSAREERVLAKLGGKSIKQAKSEVVGQIKNEIRKSAQKQDWAGFLDSITC